MRLFKFGLHAWITLISVISFLFGWVVLAHSPKPVQASQTSTASIPTLTPLQPLNFNNDGSGSGGFQQLQTVVEPPAPAPLFRTGGSQ